MMVVLKLQIYNKAARMIDFFHQIRNMINVQTKIVLLYRLTGNRRYGENCLLNRLQLKPGISMGLSNDFSKTNITRNLPERKVL